MAPGVPEAFGAWTTFDSLFGEAACFDDFLCFCLRFLAISRRARSITSNSEARNAVFAGG
tara:strand:- start:253 stop:432 length:180 start_codon:yes stop_codon:yes gene_type:complete